MTQRRLEILDPGIQTIVVDRGRFGHRSIGVAWCGAMDAPALERALALVGESPAAAAIEIAYGRMQCRFTHATHAALAGADCAALLDGSPLRPQGAFVARPGSVLVLHSPRRESRTILAVKGGIDVPLCLGSRTTDLRTGIGGFGGRALVRGDILPIGPEAHDVKRHFTPPKFMADAASVTVRATRSPEHDDFGVSSQKAFWECDWTLTNESDRMGYRFTARALQFNGMPIRSHAVFPGVVQVPPSGNPIVLMSDAQTTGGYPKIAIVLEDDLWKVAQMQTGQRLRFQPAPV